MQNKSFLSKKLLAVILFINGLLTTVSAQSGPLNQPIATSVGGFNVLSALNTVFLWEIVTWLDLTLFIAAWAGFYFATRPLLLELYGVILDNFPTSDRRNRYSTTEDGEPIGMKGLALTSSFVTAQIVGQYLGIIPMIALGGIGLTVFAYSMIVGSKNFRQNFRESMTGGESGDGDSITAGELDLDERFEEMKNELQDEFEREEDIKQKISRLRGEKEDFDTAAEELIQSGDLPENVQSDLEYLRREMDDELQKEYALADILDKVAKEQRSEVEELNDVEDLAEYVRSEFSHLVQLDRDLDQRLEEIRAEVEDIEDRVDQDGVTPELRNEIQDVSQKLDSTKREVSEAVTEAQDAHQKAQEALSELQEIDQQTSQTEDEVEEAAEEDEEVQAEAEDEEQKLDAVEQKIQEYRQKGALKADEDQFQSEMKEIHGPVEDEEAVAEEEDQEVREAYDEMMKIDHTEENLAETVEGDLVKLSEVEQDLNGKINAIQEMEKILGGIGEEAGQIKLEEEEFNKRLQWAVEDLETVRDNASQLEDVQILRTTRKALDEIDEIRSKMPPEIKNREEGRYLENMQGTIYQITGQIHNQLSPENQQKFEEMENELFPPLVRE